MLQKALLRCTTPITQFQRYRGKINIQRPRAPHYDRALAIALAKPRMPEEPPTKTCFMSREERLNLQAEVQNPYNDIIAREVRNWLQQSRMVAMFHLNPISQDNLFPIRVKLHKQNMHLKSYGKKIIAKAVANSRFEAILPLFDSQHCIVFSSDQNVRGLLRTVRKVPQLILLAGIVDNTLLSRAEFMAYAESPGLEAAQAELAHTLNLAATHLVRNLEAHQNQLVNVLDVHAKGADTDAQDTAATPAGAATPQEPPQS